MNDHRFTFEQFYTILCQIEGILNSRPLCPLPSSCDIEPLTPGHFLILRPPMSTPPSTNETPLTMDIKPSQKYKLTQQISFHFWVRWRKEYISELQRRIKWKTKADPTQPPIKEGDLVILKDESTSVMKWPLAGVLLLHPRRDGIARVATIQFSNTIKKRPITKLWLDATTDGYQRAVQTLRAKYSDPMNVTMEVLRRLKNIKRINRNDLSSVEKAYYGMRELYFLAIRNKLPDSFINFELRKQFCLRWYGDMEHRFATTSTCEDLLATFEVDLRGLTQLYGDTSTLIRGCVNHTRNSGAQSCLFCRQDHLAIFCDHPMGNAERRKIVQEKKLCYVCLRGNHVVSQCRSKYLCSRCKQRHAVVICNGVPTATANVSRDDHPQESDSFQGNADSDLVN
ncbi:UNVERIFIED_CONTAM: hypothetical protein PYX00_010801 [Menopon gallinae]|uniref:DUF5641 domain-containing protein n=1 Tax=Menopon gallinae TaxID=328185 RepID=A0AAW2HHR4_9NEOP